MLTAGQGSLGVETAFLHGLREAGYVDGRTIEIDRRSAEGDFTKLPGLAVELAKQRPAVSDPAAAGLVGNLARPRGNVTGTAPQLHTAVGKQVELMRQMLPRVDRIAILWNPAASPCSPARGS